MTARFATRIAWAHVLGLGLIGASLGGALMLLCWAAPTIAAWWRAC